MHIVNREDWLQCLVYIERITDAYSQLRRLATMFSIYREDN